MNIKDINEIIEATEFSFGSKDRASS